MTALPHQEQEEGSKWLPVFRAMGSKADEDTLFSTQSLGGFQD